MQERIQLNFAQRWKEKLSEPQQAAAQKTRLVMAGVSGVLVIGLIGSLPWAYEYKLASELSLANQKIATLKDIDKQVSERDNLRNQLANQQQVVDLTKKQTRDPNEILDQLRKYLPLGTVVNSFALNADNTVNVSLTLLGPIDVARLWVSINESSMFQPIDIKTIPLQDKTQPLNLALKLK